MNNNRLNKLNDEKTEFTAIVNNTKKLPDDHQH